LPWIGVASALQLMGMIPKTNSPLINRARAREIGKNPVDSCSSDESA
jgi:hypothetical protein